MESGKRTQAMASHDTHNTPPCIHEIRKKDYLQRTGRLHH